VNAQQYNGKTPLDLATTRGHLKFMQLLLDHGADPHAHGETQKISQFYLVYKVSVW
jgi:ankyrin repeat protein